MPYTANKRSTYSFIALSILYLTLMPRLSYPINSVLKALPIALLLLCVLRGNLSRSLRWMFGFALGFSVLGDIALTLPVQHQFEMGLGLFLIAHISYIFGFFLLSKSLHKDDGVSLEVWNMAASGIAIASLLVLIYLIPKVGDMWIPICIYIGAISIMAMTASRCDYYCMVGAASFMISDTLIAYDTFIAQKALFSFWIMLSYYAGQFCLVHGTFRAYAQVKRTEKKLAPTCWYPEGH